MVKSPRKRIKVSLADIHKNGYKVENVRKAEAINEKLDRTDPDRKDRNAKAFMDSLNRNVMNDVLTK